MLRNYHQYKVGDKILVKPKIESKHKLEFMGTFPITQINDNDTVLFHKGIINDSTNSCRIKSFLDQTQKQIKRVIKKQVVFLKTNCIKEFSQHSCFSLNKEQ